MSDQVSNWVSDVVSGWLSDQVNNQVSDWISDWISDWLSDWGSDWLSDWVNDCVRDLLSDWVSDWKGDWLRNWVSDWGSKWVSICVFHVFFFWYGHFPPSEIKSKSSFLTKCYINAVLNFFCSVFCKKKNKSGVWPKNVLVYLFSWNSCDYSIKSYPSECQPQTVWFDGFKYPGAEKPTTNRKLKYWKKTTLLWR